MKPTTPRTANIPPATGQDGTIVASETPERRSSGMPQHTKWNALRAAIVRPIGGLAPKSVVSVGSTSFCDLFNLRLPASPYDRSTDPVLVGSAPCSNYLNQLQDIANTEKLKY